MKSASKKTCLSMPESRIPLDESHNNDALVDGNEQSIGNHLPQRNMLDPNMDPKKLRRVLASRQYSQKYRLKQLHYILHLETEVKALQAEVTITSPRIKYMDRQNSLLRVQNGSMARRLSGYTSELMFKEAQYEELKKERDILKKLYVANQQVPEFLTTQCHNLHHMANVNLNQSPFGSFAEPQPKLQ